jgi:hypothetical protein
MIYHYYQKYKTGIGSFIFELSYEDEETGHYIGYIIKQLKHTSDINYENTKQSFDKRYCKLLKEPNNILKDIL